MPNLKDEAGATARHHDRDLESSSVISETDRGADRNRRVIHTFGAAVITKVIGIGTMFVSVPLVYGQLGTEQFGLWMTITSIVVAMQFADLGIGNGLLNMIAVANARDNREYARRAVTSSIGILAMLGMVVLAFFGILYPFVDWTKIYSLSTPALGSEAGIATAIMVACLALNLPLLTAQRVQMGYQDGFKANVWISLGSALSLAGVLFCSRMEAGLPAFVLAALGGPVVAAALCWIYEFLLARPWLFPSCRYFDATTGKRVVKDGAIWTLFQLMAFIGIALDNLIISYFFGVEAVAKYAVMSKLLTGLLIAQMLSAPLWPAFAEAIERGDLAWARRTFQRSMAICAGLGLAGGAVMAFLSPWIIQWWVGGELIPSLALAAGFALWCFITNFFAAISALMANQRLLPALTRLTATGAIVSFGLKIFVVPSLGPDFVIWATVIGYGLVCLPGVWMVHGLLSQEEFGAMAGSENKSI
jgi:O-antigen/teichoic acid export membrane protein